MASRVCLGYLTDLDKLEAEEFELPRNRIFAKKSFMALLSRFDKEFVSSPRQELSNGVTLKKSNSIASFEACV
jgi:hypothetical protein